jgi:hypothetical protein
VIFLLGILTHICGYSKPLVGTCDSSKCDKDVGRMAAADVQ